MDKALRLFRAATQQLSTITKLAPYTSELTNAPSATGVDAVSSAPRSSTSAEPCLRTFESAIH